MRVLIVNTSERTGGAAVAAHRLMDALNNHGVKATMLVGDRSGRKMQTNSLTVVSLKGRWRQQWHFLWERLVIFFHLHLRKKHLFELDIAIAGTDITRLRVFREADVIHLHWVNQGMLSLDGICKILRSGKPVVWTMHDMWPATAICHLTLGCNNFKTACRHCHFLPNGGSAHDLSARVWRKKQQVLAEAENITFVTVSRWLAGYAQSSALISHFPIEVIPNAISLSRFTPMNRAEARAALGIHEPVVLAFGAARIDDHIKGFCYLIRALQWLLSNGRFATGDIRLLLFGGVRDASVFDQLPISYTYLGYVNDETALSRIYSASDATISSSLYETFGQTLIEAMACGSVPVSFAGSGQADIIEHLQTGYLADRLSAESLAEGIEWAVKSQVSTQDLRGSVARRFTEDALAGRYITLYERILNKRNHD